MFCFIYLLPFIMKAVVTERSNNLEFINSEWTPITRERVFGGVKTGFVPRNHLLKYSNENYDNVGGNVHNINNEQNSRSVHEPRFLNYNQWNEKWAYSENKPIVQDYKEKSSKDDNLNNESKRKPKLILNADYINDINNLMPTNLNKETKNLEDENIKLYEVTESSETVELVTLENITNIGMNISGHLDTKVHKSNNNLTIKLLDILSSYNIRVNDELSNYDLSRHSKRTPKQEFILLPIPIKYIRTHSNLNRIAIDPLLTVIIPYYTRQYTLYSMYNPLDHYTYNAIRKPNESYKIFSDTDSSQ